jgi:hypothetical protein
MLALQNNINIDDIPIVDPKVGRNGKLSASNTRKFLQKKAASLVVNFYEGFSKQM